MTHEEMQRTMAFIVQQQAQFAVNIQFLQEERLRDDSRIVRLEESFVLVTQLAQTTDGRLDTLESSNAPLESNMSALEQSMPLLVQLAQATDIRLDKLEANGAATKSNMATLESNMAALAAAQAHADERISALIDIVRDQRNGRNN